MDGPAAKVKAATAAKSAGNGDQARECERERERRAAEGGKGRGAVSTLMENNDGNSGLRGRTADGKAAHVLHASSWRRHAAALVA